LIDVFNSGISSEAFYSKIEETVLEDPKIYNELINIIAEQDF